MARKNVYVRSDKGRLLLDFYYKNIRCREYLNVQVGKEGMRYAQRQAKLLEQELLDGTLIYAEWFPNSKKCQFFNSVSTKYKIFAEVAEEWEIMLRRLNKANELKYSTLRSYLAGLKSNKSFFDNYEMKNITRYIVDDYKFSLLESGLSKKTINNRLTPLRQIFKYAFERSYIDEDIMSRVGNFTIDMPEIEPFNKEEVNAILLCMKEKYPEMYAMFVILFHTGMRIGEVLAMRWKHFNELFGTYYIKEHFTENRLEKPKTKNSIRQIMLTDEAVSALKEHKKYSNKNSEFIFNNQYGEPWVSGLHINRSVWQPVLEELGIDYRVLYQCRHTHASLSILAGDNLAVIAERMGHKHIGTLITRYAKYVKMVQQQRPKIDSFLSTSVLDLSEYRQKEKERNSN